MNPRHERNIGLIVLAMSRHEPGRFSDSAINDPIMNLYDRFRPANEVIEMLAEFTEEHAAGIVAQLYGDIEDAGRA